jgi:hypothetical protein
MAEPPKLLDQVRNQLRQRHYAIRTEQAYLKWITEFLLFHRTDAGTWIHPLEIKSSGVNQFLTRLGVDRKVAASTQNQALSALLFLDRSVLKSEIELDAVRAKRPQRLPVVLFIDEVRKVLCNIPEGPYRVMAGLIYGAGLRLMEACRIRVKGHDRRCGFPPGFIKLKVLFQKSELVKMFVLDRSKVRQAVVTVVYDSGPLIVSQLGGVFDFQGVVLQLAEFIIEQPIHGARVDYLFGKNCITHYRAKRGRLAGIAG